MTSSSYNRFTNFLLNKNVAILFFLIFIYSFVLPSLALSNSNTDGRTPAYLQGGGPVGSYSLSGFENINLFNGNLNFSLPLYNLIGRGGSGHSLVLPIEQKWKVSQIAVPQPNQNPIFTPIPMQSNYPLFGAGRVVGRRTGEGSQGTETSWSRLWETYIPACPSPIRLYEATLTRLTFIRQDGTEIELRDQISGGQPAHVQQCSQVPFARGDTFVSADGSNITFISDTPIQDVNFNPTPSGDFPVSGYLLSPDGTKYRILNSKIEWMRDRSGNVTTFFDGVENGIPISRTTDSTGRILEVKYSGPNRPYDEILFKGFSNIQRSIKIHYQNMSELLREGFTLRTPRQLFPEMGMGASDTMNFNPRKISSVELPDGKSYQFRYNNYGELARVLLPTGGVIEYDWATGGVAEETRVFRVVTERRTYETAGVLETKTTYHSAPSSPQDFGKSTTVETRNASNLLLSKTVHYFYGDPEENSGPWRSLFYTPKFEGREHKTELYEVVNGSAVLKRRNETVWEQRQPITWYPLSANNPDQYAEPSNDPRVAEIRTTLFDTNQISKKVFLYAPNVPYNLQTDVIEYEFSGSEPVNVKRRTHTDYLLDSNYTSPTGPYLRGLPVESWISSDSAGSNKVARTQFKYDETLLMPRSNVIGWTNPNNPYRGNLTKTRNWVKYGSEPEIWLESKIEYDVLGNAVKTIDAKNNHSTIDYTDNFGIPDGEAQTNTPPTQLNGQSTFAFPTSATNSKGWVTGFSQVDYFTGKSVDVEDLNGVVNSTFYNDDLDRPTQSITANNLPDFRRQTNIIYDDANHRIETKADLNAFNDNLLKSESFYDGLGRTVESRKYESDGGYVASKSVPFVMLQDPETSVWRIGTQKSNPYRPLRGEQPVWTTTLSDSLGRGIKAITPDGAMVKTEYSGNAVTVTDQAGKKRRSVTNALGQLVRVDEPDVNNNNQLGTIDAPLQPTYYEYDTLSNLTKVKQGGTFASPVQTRTFAYDSLSRLKQATNPESGTISYVYDENGNLTKKTDARLIETNYVYDNLNRVITRSYANEPNTQRATPSVTYTYEDSSITTLKGMLTKVSNGFSTTAYTEFDLLGRVKKSQQTTDGTVYNPMEYSYNLSGALVEQKYPSGRVVKTTLDNDGDLSIVQSRRNQNSGLVAYAKHFTYTAAGAVSSMQLGNGAWESTVFNSRLQPTQIALGSVQNGTNKLKLDFTYNTTTNGTPNADNNGNVLTQTITTPSETRGTTTYSAFTAIQTYQYDALNRIKEAEEKIGTSQQWKQTFTYDRYGNRTFDEGSDSGQYKTTTLPRNCGTAPNLTVCPKDNPQPIAASNKLQGIEYDSAGNTKTDLNNRRFTYDGENKQIKVQTTDGIGNVTGTLGEYFYDGDGKRVKKVSFENSQWITTIFVYDASGKMVAEYSTQTSTTPQVSYLTNDHLGSPRANTDAVGNVTARHDYQPFGEEVQRASHGTDQVRKQFTSYERDNESDLDFAQARYYKPQHGRFTTVDPLMASADPMIPQSWNRYIYVGNNPLNITDPTGLSWYYNKNLGDGGTYRWYGDDETVGEGFVSVVGNNGQAGSFSYQAAGGGYVTLDPYSNNYQTGIASQADAIKLGDRLYQLDPRIRAFAAGFNKNYDTNMALVTAMAVGDIAIIAAPVVATALAGGSAPVTLGLAEAGTAATTTATVAAANPDKTAQVVEAIAIQFGKGANQVSHAFRHIDKLGLNRSDVQSAVETDLRGAASTIQAGAPATTRIVEVGGQMLRYNVYKMTDGTLNVGRIHELK